MRALPATVREFMVSTSAGRLSVGEARPIGGVVATSRTVVLVPGFTGSKEDFIPLLDELTGAGYRVIAYSQMGQWRSEGPAEAAAYTVEAFAAGLLDVLAETADDTPVHVVGHSFGGLVTRAAVIRSPERFASHTLLCSGPDGAARGPTGPDFQAVVAAEGSTGAWRVLGPFLAAGQPPAVTEFLRARVLGTKAANLRGIAMAIGAEPDRVDALGRTGVPILVAHGEHDNAWTAAAQRTMAERLGARYEVIADAGHLPNHEQPLVTARLLTEFWRSVAGHGGKNVPAVSLDSG